MASQMDIPRLRGDQTIAFLREGYDFIARRCRDLGSDVFAARLMLQPVTCLHGAEAAEMVYGNDRLTRRRGAMPPTVLRLLQDKGSVQQLDGPDHRHRKAMFVDLLMTDAAEASFIGIFREEWRLALDDWAERPSIVLLDEAYLVLTRSVCRWAGVPLGEGEDVEMAHELSAMIENAGSIGAGVVAALWRRRRTERAMARLVSDIRTGRAAIPGDAPVSVIANHRDRNGERLPVEVAAVEVINILRPVAAVARYVMFSAMALHEHPAASAALTGAGSGGYEAFAEEVRRLYPFFPLIGAKAIGPFEWKGIPFEDGDWLLLDLHGTNHDPRHFPAPGTFDPSRAISWRQQGGGFVPQGVGDARRGHRCPGERLTVAVIAEATRLMVEEMEARVAPQDLTMPPGRMPAKPKSGLILTDIARRDGSA